MLRKSIPRKPGQGSSVLSRQKTATNHTPSRILFARNVNKFLGSSMSRSIADRIYVGAEPQFNTLRVVAMRPLDETFANERAKRSAPLSVRLHLLDMGVATFAIEHCVEGTSGRAEKLGDLIVSLRTIGRDAGNCVDPLL